MNSPPPNTNAAAIILAGGKSSRMGQPKAMLLFDGRPLIEHIVGKLKLLFSQIIVVAAPGQEIAIPELTIVRDDQPYQGPVGGIYYGLRASERPIAFVTSCDAPFLNLSLIAHLVGQIPDYDVVVPFWEDRFQPLHAVYRSSVLPKLEKQLERKELRPIFLFDKVRTRKVLENEIRQYDSEGLSFLNMNTPQDYEAASRLWRQANETNNFDGSVRCAVELFGVARLLAKVHKLTLMLPNGATAADLFSELATELPVLIGRVIKADTRGLVNGHACSLNGREFVRDPSVRINTGDCIFLISADAGG